MIKEFYALLELALQEDLGEKGDVTSRAIFQVQKSVAVLKSKQSGILAGIEFFKEVFLKVDPELKVEILKRDGDSLNPGDIAARIKGATVSILEAERTAINFISFLSGIATMTARNVLTARKNGKSIIQEPFEIRRNCRRGAEPQNGALRYGSD